MISLLAFAGVNTVLRAASLGYSNFQGDEVAAQDYLFGNQDILQFLLTRSKGPLQYLLTYSVNGIVLGKVDQPEGFLREPFLLAGILSVVAVYLLGARYWSRRAGLIAAFLLAGSGLFLAFSRVAQYQSFVVLLSILTYYEFIGHLEDGATWRLVTAGSLSGVALLFHYDALSFIVPIALLLATQCVRSERRGTSLLYYLAPLALVSGVFYIPFILNPEFSSTASYLLGQRITSEFRYDSLYYSLRLLAIYHSKEFLILLFLGLSVFAGARMKKGGRVVVVMVVLLTGLVVGRILHADRVRLLVYASTLVGAAMAGSLLIRQGPDSGRGGRCGVGPVVADFLHGVWPVVRDALDPHLYLHDPTSCRVGGGLGACPGALPRYLHGDPLDGGPVSNILQLPGICECHARIPLEQQDLCLRQDV